ncbi:MAG: tRNA 2-selenouridine(34) synthase MnmH [Gemmobacter sp.]
MALHITSVLHPLDAGYDDIIDVRAPSEYAADHLPGAINLPVLSDEERARVGTIYKQVSPFSARKLGAALVARNAAAHLEGVLADRPGGWRPLVYCWRGGQRSGSFATILSAIGWRVETVAGGYKAWRRLVVEAVTDAPFPAPVVLIDGDTGTAKTALLAAMAAQGVQVIDLEELARHRGSIFGAAEGGQPTQRAFEGALAVAMARLDPARPVAMEAESPMLGALQLPPAVLRAMRAAVRIEVAAPRAERAAYLLRAYPDLGADRGRLAALIERLRPWQPREVIEGWQGMVSAGALLPLAEGLIARHYDPLYARARARSGAPTARLDLPSLDAAGIAAGAGALAALVAAGR